MVYPLTYRISTIQGGPKFPPSTVVKLLWWLVVVPDFLRKKNSIWDHNHRISQVGSVGSIQTKRSHWDSTASPGCPLCPVGPRKLDSVVMSGTKVGRGETKITSALRKSDFWNYHWLVVDLPLWKMMEWKSVGMMTFPILMESHKSHVPNHQPDILWYIVIPLINHYEP